VTFPKRQVALKVRVHLIAAERIRGRGFTAAELGCGLAVTAQPEEPRDAAGERSIASYVLDPVVQTFDESLREP